MQSALGKALSFVGLCTAAMGDRVLQSSCMGSERVAHGAFFGWEERFRILVEGVHDYALHA